MPGVGGVGIALVIRVVVGGFGIPVVQLLGHHCKKHGNEHKIQGYPTIVLTKDGKNIEYDAKVDEATLKQFITTMV